MRSESKANVLLVGTGVVGSAVVNILHGEGSLPIELAAVANTRGIVPTDAGVLTKDEVKELRARPRGEGKADDVIGDAFLDAFAKKENAVLVDATAADGIEDLYLRALERGIHVVTANKKPLVVPHEKRQRLFDPAARKNGARFRYEATVGAGLPVIETVKDLVRTGDRVKKIECVLSGTLGFVANELFAGTPLSQAVAVAKDRGFTEPDPREDLGGADVARKAVILARELGAELELSDVDLTPFVPTYVKLTELDMEIGARVKRLKERGEKLVYLARIERDADGRVKASAGPVAVPLDHPAATLAGSSALVSFTSARYATDPLVVRGSGAGGPVTASAVLADVLKATGLA